MNQLKEFPPLFSFPQLKTVSFNSNPELSQVTVGCCPMLESLSLSQCSISDEVVKVGNQSLSSYIDLAACPKL